MIDGLISALLQLGHFTSHYIKFWSSIYPYVTAFFNLVLQELRSFTKGLISHYENRLFLEILNAAQKETKWGRPYFDPWSSVALYSVCL